MDKNEAESILQTHCVQYKTKKFHELQRLVHNQETTIVIGKYGTKYHVEFQAHWDDTEQKCLRVCGAIDSGGWRAFSPITQEFIIAQDGTLVDL